MRKKKIKDKKIKNIFSNQKGMALLTTLIFVFILVTFAVTLLTMTSNDTKLSALQRDSTKAFYIAEAGIERTLYNLKKDYETDQDWSFDNINGYPFEEVTSEFRKINYANSDPPGYEVSFGEGIYTVSLKINSDISVTIKSKGKDNKTTRYVQVDATIGSLSIWDNAIFAGSGAIGNVINGNVDIRGSVHILGSEDTTAMEALDVTGGAGIGNNYDGMDSGIRSRITDPPRTTFNGEDVETLNAVLRVKYGKVNISGNSSVGDPDEYGNGYKETMDGVYVTDGFGGNKAEEGVFSDNGAGNEYDLGGSTVSYFPLLDETYKDSEGNTYDCGGSDCTYLEYYTKYGLYITDSPTNIYADEVNKISSISSDTESFTIPSSGSEDENGNFIGWDKESHMLTIKGIIFVDVENIKLEIGDINNPPPPIEYSGIGTIVSKKDITIHSDLLAKETFPTEDSLGFIACNNINIPDPGEGGDHLRTMGAFYAQNQIASEKQNQIAGTFVSNYFDMGTNVPKIFQVPGLENNLPPGMPGATVTYTMHTSNWHEVYE